MVDPTWDPGVGLAYLGVIISDSSLWPTDDNRGVFDDYQRGAVLLRDGLPPGDRRDFGRGLPVADED